ncbi:sulfotransferase 1E1-like [Daphnia carinata]|uniref:sulfotransferase 1E1-like n=1 Tax=Daphnia carinata TaxID=120202 RepID=UPI0025800F41|nr:sulfotransferase 1E1-like [Daphnia carinata]
MSLSNGNNLKQLQLRVQFYSMPQNEWKKLRPHFPGYTSGLVRSEPGKFVMNPLYGFHAEKLYHMQPRSDDVWLLGFPKCGTTWTSELIWLLMNDCDTARASGTHLIFRTPCIELPFLTSEIELSPQMMNLLNSIEKMESPRVLKSHLPFYLLHPDLLETSKVVYIARNPKDVIVSFYHHTKLVKRHNFQGTLEQFAEYFLEDEILCSPYFPHVLDAWSKRHHPHMHFMFFEDLKRDLRGEIEKVADFLGQTPSDEQLTKITNHLRFENLRHNDSVNNELGKRTGFMNKDGNFMRKGKTGDWKNHFSPELNSKIDKWIEKNLKGSDLSFITELDQQD